MIEGSWITCLIEDGEEFSAEIDLGKVFEKVIIDFPAISAARIDVQGARVAGGDYRLIWSQEAGNKHAAVTGTSETGDLMWVVPIGGLQYIRLRSYPDQDTDETFYIMGVRS